MDQTEFDAFLLRQEAEYRESLSATLPFEVARSKARQDCERILPEGLDTQGQRLLSVEDDDGDVVGQVWLATAEPQTGATDVAWLYQLRIEEAARRHGYARAVMLAIETVARDAGATRLRLNVFGGNAPAIRLYERCGYVVATQQMTKILT